MTERFYAGDELRFSWHVTDGIRTSFSPNTFREFEWHHPFIFLYGHTHALCSLGIRRLVLTIRQQGAGVGVCGSHVDNGHCPVSQLLSRSSRSVNVQDNTNLVSHTWPGKTAVFSSWKINMSFASETITCTRWPLNCIYYLRHKTESVIWSIWYLTSRAHFTPWFSACHALCKLHHWNQH